MSQAWHSAAFQRADKLPKLEKVLIRPKATAKRYAPTSLDEQRALMNVLSQQFGIPLRKTRLKKKAKADGR